jgi:hypothetical protein
MTDVGCYTASIPQTFDVGSEGRDTIHEVADASRQNLRETADASRHAVRETSESARHTVAEASQGFQFAATDRANQDRYLAGEFRTLGRQTTDFESRLQKDRCDKSEWDNERARDLAKDIERNGRSAELATEKTAAATILAIEKTAAAQALALQECCCEMKELVREESDKTRSLVSQIDRERLQARLAVLEARVAV